MVDALREVTGIGLARAENLVESTQNADALVEAAEERALWSRYGL